MLLVLGIACVLDRTGQSGTDAIRRELILHDQQISTLETDATDATRRLVQVEEVTRTLGQDQLDRLETLESIRQEVASLRGDVDVLVHETDVRNEAADGFQVDTDARLRVLEARVQNLERTLGVKPPDTSAITAGTGTAGTASTAGTTGTATASTNPTASTTEATTSAAPSTPDEFFALIETNLQDGNNTAARSVAQRFLQDNPTHNRAPEAQYRIAESFQNEKKYKEAAASYQVVVDKYKDSSWAPWAMLRQGECFDSLGRRDAAELFWNDLIRLYPKSKAAKEAKTYLSQK